MIPFLRNLSASTIKVFYSLLAIALLIAASYNFIQNSFVHAQSNDECAWIRLKSNDSVLVIRSIIAGGVADEAGLLDGDTVTRINDHKFSYETSQSLINSVKKGDYAVYTVHRNSQVLSVPIRIVKVINLFTVSLFITGIAFLMVGLLTVLSRPKGELQQRFMNYCLSNAFVFSLGTGINLSYYNLPQGFKSILAIFLLVLLVLILPQQVRFFFFFPRRSEAASKRWLNIGLYTFSFFIVSANVFLRDGVLAQIIPEGIITNILRGFSETLQFSFYPAGLGMLSQIYFSDIPKDQRRPIRPIIFAFFMSAMSLISFSITVQSVPFALYLRPELFLPMLLFVTTPLAIAYSIFRYGLMDVSIIVERSLIFAIATAVLAVIYFATVSVLSSLLSGYVATMFELGPNPGDNFWVTVIAFVMLGLVFDPVKRRTEEWVARIFYQERINYQKALLELSRELPGLINFTHIVEVLTTRLKNTMHLEHVTIVLNDERYSDFYGGAEVQSQSYDILGANRDQLLSELQSSKQPVYVEHTADVESEREATSKSVTQRKIVLAVPLLVKNDLLGVIAVGKKQSGKGFSKEDLDLLMTIASQAAVAIENARLHESEIQKQKMEDSLAIARRIQQSLLPQHWPKIQGLDVHGASIPAEIVGGDFYDLIELSPTKLLVVVGDVSGKGISAALYMSKIQGMMQLAANRYDSPRDMLIHVNRYIYGSMEKNSFVTMIVALFDVDQKIVRVCRAGHTKALLSQGSNMEFINSRGLGIGLCGTELFSRHLQELELPLQADSTFVFYSDGLNEAVNEKQEQFGTDVLQNIVKVFRSFPAKTVLTNIEQAVDTFRHQTELYDDLTIVVVKTSKESSL